MSASAPSAKQRKGARRRRPRSKALRLLGGTLAACFRYRVTGLAAEAAFFAILSLPPLLFGLAGSIGFIAQRFDVATVAEFRSQILTLAGTLLTADSVNTIIAPTLDDVLSSGRFEVISLGFLIALWSGSRALNVLVDTITIMYGLAGRRGVVRTRALSFLLYLTFLLIGVVLIPLVLAGPRLVDLVLPDNLAILAELYWPVVLVATVAFLTSLFNWSIPLRTRWRSDLPGAVLTFVIWILGSELLRLVLEASVGTTTIYGPLAAPIAVLIWLYVVSLAVLVGAAFNAALDVVYPSLSGIDHREEQRDPVTTPEEAVTPLHPSER